MFCKSPSVNRFTAKVDYHWPKISIQILTPAPKMTNPKMMAVMMKSMALSSPVCLFILFNKPNLSWLSSSIGYHPSLKNPHSKKPLLPSLTYHGTTIEAQSGCITPMYLPLVPRSQCRHKFRKKSLVPNRVLACLPRKRSR